MKIALIGNGRTGGKVHEVVSEEDEVVDFNHDNPPTAEKLSSFDVAVCFLPGDAFLENYQTLIDSGVPVVTGSTGFIWPENADKDIVSNNVAWVTASNFSLGMQLVHYAITQLSQAPELLGDLTASIHEIHHIHKKDSPSGTALKWQEWYGAEVNITSEKIGETIGDHKLTLDTPTETITIQHVAKDRKIFAAGALWAARKISELDPGLYKFEDVVSKFKSKEN